MDLLNQVNVWITYLFVCAGFVGQGFYVALFLTREWNQEGWPRALFSGRLAFFLLLSNSFIVLMMYGLRPLDWPAWLLSYRILTTTLMLSAIYYQLFALFKEIRDGYDEDMKRV